MGRPAWAGPTQSAHGGKETWQMRQRMGGGFPGFGVAAMAVSMAASAAAAPALPTIALEPQGEAWRVTYALAEPVRVLQFAREDAKGNRARTWVPVDARLELVLVDGHEVVRARDGSAFRGASFDVPPVYMPLDKDYAPFSPFGDGGLLIHSGRFHACPGDCAAFGDDPAWAFAVTPRASRTAAAGPACTSARRRPWRPRTCWR
jgi:hypothetical protein